MGDNSTAQSQWNPVAEFRQLWPNAKISDADVLKNLQDPAKFRSAFPHYTGVTDDMIRTKMKAYSPMDMPSQPKGDVRPSVSQVQSSQDAQKPSTFENLENRLSLAVGRMIPDAAVPYMAAFQKHVNQPLDRLAEIGGKAAGFGLRAQFLDPVGSDQAQVGITNPETYYKQTEQATQRHPIAGGVLEGAGEIVGGTVSDPRMLALTVAGDELPEAMKVGNAFKKLASRGFTAQMLYQAASSSPDIRDALNRKDYYEAARLTTSAVGAGLFGALGLKGEAKSKAEKVVRSTLDKTTGANPVGPQATQESTDQSTPKGPIPSPSDAKAQDLNKEVTEIKKTPFNATTLDPISQTGGQDTHIDFTTKAPAEAHAPVTASGASMVANAPEVDRQALIAPDPSRFVGAETPVPLYRFPRTSIENMPKGETQGLGKVDLSKPEVKDPVGGQEMPVEQARPAPEIAPASVPTAPKYVPKSPDLPDVVKDSFKQMANLSRLADLAETDQQKAALNARRTALAERSKAMLRVHMGALDGDQLGQLRDSTAKEAEKLEAQARAIKSLTESTIKNRGVKQEIADLRSEGGPVRNMVIDQETGERAVVKPEERAGGRGARAVFDELQGRVPTSQFEALKVAAKPEGVTDQEWSEHVGRLQQERQGLKKKISDAVTLAADTGSSAFSEEGGIQDHIARLKEIEGMLGKYAEVTSTGRRPNPKAELDEQGAITAPEALKSWTLAEG